MKVEEEEKGENKSSSRERESLHKYKCVLEKRGDILIFSLSLSCYCGGHDRRDMFPSAEAINGNGNTQQQQWKPRKLSSSSSFISTARWTQRKGQPTE
jgi:hypothetical protein